jgi:hypothetical protein
MTDLILMFRAQPSSFCCYYALHSPNVALLCYSLVATYGSVKSISHRRAQMRLSVALIWVSVVVIGTAAAATATTATNNTIGYYREQFSLFLNSYNKVYEQDEFFTR